MSYRIKILFPIFLALFSATVWAVEIKDKNGQIYQGEILESDAETFFLETSNGLMTIKKSEVVLMDGQPYVREEIPAPAAKPAKQLSGSNSKKEYAVRVGSSGLSAQELSIYLRGLSQLERHQHLSGRDWGTSNSEIRKAIEDEMAFQEALKSGLHREPAFQKQIAGLYQAQQTLGDIHPQLFSDSEMKAYYDKNKKEFMKPAEYRFNTLSKGGAAVNFQSALSNPESVSGWRKGNWMKEGDSFYLPLSEDQMKQIYNLRKGKLLQVRDGMNGEYIFWCVDYKPPVQKNFQEARERVKHLMIRAKESGNLKSLKSQLSPQGSQENYNQVLFETALSQGYARDRNVRDQLINTYLQRQGKTLGEVVLQVQDQYKVEITQGE